MQDNYSQPQMDPMFYALFQQMQGQQKQPTGLAGLLGGPYGGLLSSVGGGLLSLLGGDGGRGKRMREAQGAFRGLANSQVNEGDFSRGADLFRRSSLPQLSNLYGNAAKHIGLDSGLGQGYALGQFQDLLGGFNSDLYQRLISEREQNKRLGAQGLASLVG